MFISSNHQILKSIFRPYYPDTCIGIDISKHVQNTPVRSLTFRFASLSNYGVNILVEDKELACNRPIMEHQLLFSGNAIRLSSSKQNIGKSYSVAFEKVTFVENDPSKNCENYPTAHYKSYKDCDNAFIKEAYKQFNQLDPVWASGLLLKNVSSNFEVPNYDDSVFINIFNGITRSKCPQPCSTVRVISRLAREWKKYEDFSLIDIAPSSLVLVTRTDFVKPPISSLVAEFGGAMGLWLGLGVVQLVQTSFILCRKYLYRRK